MEKKAVGDVRNEEIYTGITNVRDESGEQFNCDGIGSSPSRVSHGGIPSPRESGLAFVNRQSASAIKGGIKLYDRALEGITTSGFRDRS